MRTNAATKPAVEVVNFGCRVNLVEGEALRQAVLAEGHDNLTIVNSCAVTAEAARQVRQTIRRLKREAPERRIVVTGCGAQIDPASFAAMPEVDRVVGTLEKIEADAFAPHRENRVAVSDVFARKTANLPSLAGIEEHTRAFLAVQTGCDHRCSFCIIPFGRGASRSMQLTQLREAVAGCLDKGVAEIVLTGVDLTAYGKDLLGVPSLADALRHVLDAAPDLPRLRLSSIDCIETDRDFFNLMASESRLMPHLHLSLQSGDDLILKRMKRRHSRADAVEFCAALRRARPDIVFGADLIAGFPTETDAMFENTLALVEDCGLTHLHVFPFSPRPGTPAARMPQLAPMLIKERAARLREAGVKALSRHLDAQIGRRLTLLTERGGIARAEDFTKVRIDDIAPGRIVERIPTSHDGETLRV
ncbi:MAG TPA: tRNA (N(6)-L-threonylcarbamoyladenosine(37)-C(2))-methylthiotransferase MtaB [Methylovirgula sp.]|jgi:threonylcarbamoyladenosine tRNA methylthiotransferase MtaB